MILQSCLDEDACIPQSLPGLAFAGTSYQLIFECQPAVVLVLILVLLLVLMLVS